MTSDRQPRDIHTMFVRFIQFAPFMFYIRIGILQKYICNGIIPVKIPSPILFSSQSENKQEVHHPARHPIARSPHFTCGSATDILTNQSKWSRQQSTNTFNTFTMKTFSILFAGLFAVSAKADSRLLQTAAPVAVVPVAVVTPVAVPTGSSVKSASASSSKSSRRKLQTAVPVAVVPVAVVTPVAAPTGSSVKSASSSKSSRRTL